MQYLRQTMVEFDPRGPKSPVRPSVSAPALQRDDEDTTENFYGMAGNHASRTRMSNLLGNMAVEPLRPGDLGQSYGWVPKVLEGEDIIARNRREIPVQWRPAC